MRCVESIRRHSAHPHQVLVHVNDGSDGTLEWVRQSGLIHTHSSSNIGICYAVNEAATKATHEWILYLNDDMVCLPGWDTALIRAANAQDKDLFMLSGTMIEPVASGNPCVVVGDYGRDIASFREQDLLAALPTLTRNNWLGATWPPTLVHRRWWHMVGGYSIELSPGMSSDNDFSMKLWHAGCRTFLGVGDSLVYHFQCKSTGKVSKNNGRSQFLHKWGISQSTFDSHYIRRGLNTTDGQAAEPDESIAFKWAILKNTWQRRLD